ncbi:MAG TPA: hypothetical protein VHE79_08815 [Spirochaetia bacterium]
MKLKFALPVVLVAAAVLSSCMSAPPRNSLYRSNAPEVRGERAISSNIELVSEVNLDSTTLGVFYAREVYGSGDTQTLLFTQKAKGFGDSKKLSPVTDYDLSETSSLTVAQGRKLLGAIEEYLAKDPKSLAPTQMFNFELYSGTVDMSKGSDKYRPFSDITFVVVCSVTNSGKSFKTVFPSIVMGMYGPQYNYYPIELKDDQVKSLRDAIKAALDKATPEAATPKTSGT